MTKEQRILGDSSVGARSGFEEEVHPGFAGGSLMNFRDHHINRTWFAEEKIDLYRQMVRIRRFEQAALKCYQAGKIGGWLILGIGQESLAAGVRSLMGPRDQGISGPRGIGHALAAGMEMGPCMAEFFGRRNGCSKGMAGAFSLFDPARRHWGCHGLASAHTPLAAGLAFALKQKAVPGVVFCFLGDGSVNQGGLSRVSQSRWTIQPAGRLHH